MKPEHNFFEMLENGFDDCDDYIEDLRDIITLFSKGQLTKGDLMTFAYSYDVYLIYHMLFELFGCEMSKDEYAEFRERYVKTFDLEFVPLPECCLKLDEKWGF